MIQCQGGIATNIGIHFFDMLSWVFGKVIKSKVFIRSFDRSSGYIEFEKARVRWFLSINSETLPKKCLDNDLSTYRSITINNEELEFSEGFTELHNVSYENILNGKGFKISDSRDSIETAYNIRNAKLSSIKEDYHPFVKLKQSKHPFEI